MSSHSCGTSPSLMRSQNKRGTVSRAAGAGRGGNGEMNARTNAHMSLLSRNTEMNARTHVYNISVEL